MDFNDFDCMIVEEALNNYLSYLDESIPSLEGVSPENILLNVSSARSALKKVKKMRTRDCDMNANELKAIYLSVHMYLETVSSASIPKGERRSASEAKASCRKILSGLSAAFSASGYNINSFLGLPEN